MKIASVDVGIRNLAIIVVNYNDSEKRCEILHWEVVDVGSIRGTKSDITQAVLETLVDFPESLVQVDRIYIEQQPPKNPTMVRVAHTIGAFYQMQALYEGRDLELIFVSATCKNRYVNSALCLARTKLYRENKQRGVRVVQGMRLPEHFAQALAGSRKKDDLCDCLLQLVSQIQVSSWG